MTFYQYQVRIEALQMLRSLLLAGAANYDEMYNALRTLDVPFQACFPLILLFDKICFRDYLDLWGFSRHSPGETQCVIVFYHSHGTSANCIIFKYILIHEYYD